MVCIAISLLFVLLRGRGIPTRNVFWFPPSPPTDMWSAVCSEARMRRFVFGVRHFLGVKCRVPRLERGRTQ